MSKTRNPTQNPAKKPAEQNFIIVDFLDLDTSCFTFGDVKDNKYGGHFIPLKYKDKSLYVKTPARVCPFGITAGKEEKPEYKGKYPDGKKITGYSAAISFPKEFEQDPYYLKALELDKFFIDQCHANSTAWCLGGSKAMPMDRATVAGYDEKGWNGKWKRIVKWSYKDDPKTKDRTYQPYPPRMDFGIPTTTMTEYPGEDNLLKQEAIFKTTFFDAEGNKLEPVNSSDADTVLPKFSRVSTLSQWSAITQGTYGASLKPKAQQFRVYPSEGLPDADNCYLGDEDEAAELPDMLGGMPAEVVIQQRPSTALPKGAKAAAEPVPVAVPVVPVPTVPVPITTLASVPTVPSTPPTQKVTPRAVATPKVAPKKKTPSPEPVAEESPEDPDEVVDEGDAVEAGSDVEREPTPEPEPIKPVRTRREVTAKKA